jgi:putative aminopeptidase FrvX
LLGDVKFNGGPGLTIGGFTNPRVYQLLVATATNAGITYQYDIQAGYTGTGIEPDIINLEVLLLYTPLPED